MGGYSSDVSVHDDSSGRLALMVDHHHAFREGNRQVRPHEINSRRTRPCVPGQRGK